MDLRRAVAIAAVLHAAVFLGLLRFPRSPSAGSGAEASTPRPPDVAQEWEVALESALAPASLAPEPAARAERVASASSRLPLASAREARELGAISRSRSDDARLADAPESVPAPAWTFSPITPPPPDLALPSSSEQARAARAEPSSARGLEGLGAETGAASGTAAGPGSDRSSNVLRDALHAADVAKGRAIGNPILGVARDVTMQQPSPVIGDVVFEARVDGSGHVVDVRVTRADGDRSAWEAVRRGLVEALRGRTIPVSASASRGALIAVAIKSRWTLPSTHGPGVEIGVPFLPGLKTSKGSKDPARVDIMVTPDGDVSVGTNLDPTDVGARPLRTVTTRIVGETLL